MKNIVQLLMTMIVTYDNYGDSIGYTKEELDNLVKKWDLTNQDFNELSSIILYEEGYITKDEFAKSLDVEIGDDGDFWMVFNDFESVLGSDFTFEAKVLSGRIWEDWNPSSYTDYDFSLSDFSEKTLKAIIEYCTDNGCEIDTDDELLLTKDNMRIENGSIYVNDENLDEHMEDDGMSELKNNIQIGIADAHESAEASEIYDQCKRNFKDGIGEFKMVDRKNGKGEDLWVRVEADLSEIKSSLEEGYMYSGVVDYVEESYGEIYYVLKEYDYLDMDKPNYDYLYSSPKRKDVDDCVRERVLSGW